MKSLQQLHEDMQHALVNHSIATRSCDIPYSFSKSYERRHQFLPAYWLNKYYTCWDDLERVGLKLQVEIPATPHFPSDQALRWNEHNGREEPRRAAKLSGPWTRPLDQ